MNLRVLSHPPRHDYVDRLHGVVATLVHRDQPWPRLPDFHDPDWIVAHRDDWDLAHLHFTWEQYPPAVLDEVITAHRRTGTPVVWTVHDLRNPHTGDDRADEPYLRLLADRADAVVTLTAGAAAQVRRRFGRTATVIPHGPLVPVPEIPAWRARRPARTGHTTVLLHAKSLRRNLDVDTPVRVAVELAEDGLDLRLLVAAHDEAAVRARLAGIDRPGVTVEFHPRWSADELRAAIVAADALLLPYRWGTHSGMVELATDLGVPVLASTVGHLAEQAPVVPVGVRDAALDPASLADALRRVAEGQLPGPVPPGDRAAALEAFLAGHRWLYASLHARSVS